jgi:uncharacterized protein
MTQPNLLSGPSGPLAAEHRSQLIDTLRALALYGVVVMNLVAMVMAFKDEEIMGRALPLDFLTGSFDLVFVQGKARSAFAFLFGVGFGVMLLRAQARGEAIGPFYLRRMLVLFVFGVVNQLFFYWGDILMVYAVLGMTLPGFLRWPDRGLLWLGGLLVLLPPLLHGGYEILVGPVPNVSGPVDWDANAARALSVYMQPDFSLAVVAENLRQYVDPWLDETVSRLVYVVGVLGLFLLGMVCARHGLLFDVDAHRPLLRRIAAVGLLVGLPLSILHATLYMGWAPEQPWAGLQSASYLGLPVMALGYIALFSLLLFRRGAWIKRALAPVGRMGLTNYLASNLIGTLYFHGYGFGQMGVPGMFEMHVFIWIVFIALALFSHAWLSRFSHGPAEWLWRRLTYRR